MIRIRKIERSCGRWTDPAGNLPIANAKCKAAARQLMIDDRSGYLYTVGANLRVQGSPVAPDPAGRSAPDETPNAGGKAVRQRGFSRSTQIPTRTGGV